MCEHILKGEEFLHWPFKLWTDKAQLLLFELKLDHKKNNYDFETSSKKHTSLTIEDGSILCKEHWSQWKNIWKAQLGL